MSSFRATMVAKRASATFLGIFAMLLLTAAGAEEKPAKLSQPSLIVTPASSMANMPRKVAEARLATIVARKDDIAPKNDTQLV